MQTDLYSLELNLLCILYPKNILIPLLILEILTEN